MTAKPSDPKLPGTRRRKPQGTVEKHANADLRALDKSGVLPEASDAMRSAYRLMGRMLDIAVAMESNYHAAQASRELRAIRAQLLSEGGGYVDDSELETFLASLPRTPEGHPTQP